MVKAWDYMANFKDLQLKNKSPKSVSAYISDLKKFQSFLKRDFEELRNEDIEEYKVYLLDKKIKGKTVNRKLVSIRKYIDYLNKAVDGINLDIEIRFLKMQRQEYLTEILEIHDLERMVRTAENAKDKRALAIFYTLYYTGVRVSEMLTLTVDKINDKYIEICGKGDKIREISIGDNLRKYLKDYILERKHKFDSKIFLNKKKDTPMNRQAVHNVIKYYAGKSRIKKSLAHAHSFRHLFAKRLLQEGTLITTVATLLGHSDVKTTMIYTQETKEESFKAPNKL